MNKISDLKVGDYIITFHFGKVKVESIRLSSNYMDKVFVRVNGTEYPFNDFGIDWEKTNELNNKQMKELKIEDREPQKGQLVLVKGGAFIRTNNAKVKSETIVLVEIKDNVSIGEIVPYNTLETYLYDFAEWCEVE